MREKAIELLEKAELKTDDFKNEAIYNTIINNIAELLNKLELQENYNDMLVNELNELKSENDRMQEHLMHNEAELIPLREENKELHFKNDVLEDICLQHQNLTQWIEEEISDENDNVIECSHDFLQNLFWKVHKLNR